MYFGMAALGYGPPPGCRLPSPDAGCRGPGCRLPIPVAGPGSRMPDPDPGCRARMPDICVGMRVVARR